MTFIEYLKSRTDSDRWITRDGLPAITSAEMGNGWNAAKADSQSEIDALKKENTSLRVVIENKCCDKEKFDALQNENELLNQEVNYALQQCSMCQLHDTTAHTKLPKKSGKKDK